MVSVVLYIANSHLQVVVLGWQLISGSSETPDQQGKAAAEKHVGIGANSNLFYFARGSTNRADEMWLAKYRDFPVQQWLY